LLRRVRPLWVIFDVSQWYTLNLKITRTPFLLLSLFNQINRNPSGRVRQIPSHIRTGPPTGCDSANVPRRPLPPINGLLYLPEPLERGAPQFIFMTAQSMYTTPSLLLLSLLLYCHAPLSTIPILINSTNQRPCLFFECHRTILVFLRALRRLKTNVWRCSTPISAMLRQCSLQDDERFSRIFRLLFVPRPLRP